MCDKAWTCGLLGESQRSEPHKPLPTGPLRDTEPPDSITASSHVVAGAAMPALARVWLTLLTRALGKEPQGPSVWALPQARKLQGQLSQQYCPQAFCTKAHLICKATKATHSQRRRLEANSE